jgi:hypothetical protein
MLCASRRPAANIKVLVYSNVETFITFRSSTPLVLCIFDYLFLGRELPGEDRLTEWRISGQYVLRSLITATAGSSERRRCICDCLCLSRGPLASCQVEGVMKHLAA